MLQKLSGEKHFDGDEHNAEYDHEAFVGREAAKSFDEMTPEESQKQLGLVLAALFILVKLCFGEYIALSNHQ